MSPEQVTPEQAAPNQEGLEQDGPVQDQLNPATAEDSGSHARTPVRRRKPVLDQKLAQAKDFALAALADLVPAEEIGDSHRVSAEDDRLVTHYFASTKRGYRHWEWYVSIARAPRQTEPTVCETGILPSEDALLAPEWVPWSERLSDEEKDSESGEETEDEQGSTEQGSQILHPDVVPDLDDQSGDHHQEGDPNESVAPGDSHA